MVQKIAKVLLFVVIVACIVISFTIAASTAKACDYGQAIIGGGCHSTAYITAAPVVQQQCAAVIQQPICAQPICAQPIYAQPIVTQPIYTQPIYAQAYSQAIAVGHHHHRQRAAVVVGGGGGGRNVFRQRTVIRGGGGGGGAAVIVNPY